MTRPGHASRGDPPPFRHCYRWVAALVCGALALQALLPGPAQGAYDDYDVLSSQLNGLVGQRSSMLVQLAQADGTVGALLARDTLAALVPSLNLEAESAMSTAARAMQHNRRPPVMAATPVRFAAAGMLLGPHLAQPVAAQPATPVSITPRSWNEAVLTADALAIVPASSSQHTSANLVPLLAPAALTPLPQATAQSASLGTAQDAAPLHAVELGDRAVPVSVIAPQARVHAPPLVVTQPAPILTPAVVRGPLALGAYATVTAAQRAALSAITVPDGLPSAGLDPHGRVTQLDDLQRTIGHYTFTVPPGGSPTLINAPGFLAPQVTWTFSATTSLAGGKALVLAGNGHTDGGALHDLSLHAATTEASQATSAQPGTTLTLALAPDGAAELTAVSTLTNTTTITTLARIDGVGNDPALQTALAQERLALTELSGVLQAGNAVYARLHPLYLIRAQAYTRDLATVMAANATLEQGWWAREEAWRTYQEALTRWKQHRDAWNAYLAAQSRIATPASASHTPAGAPPTIADTATVPPTSTMAAQALPLGTAPPSPSVTTQQIFPGHSAALSAPYGQAAMAPARAPAAGITPIFGGPPVSTATAQATSSPTPVLGAPTVSIPPTATETALVLPSPLPIAGTTPVTDTTPITAVPAPPGAEPVAVPSPGLEPVFQPLPAPLPALPPWVDAPPPSIPSSLSNTLSHGLGAFGYAAMTAEQLLAGGALENLSGFIPPVKGVITTLWGGSTPWQSFHPGIDIAAPDGTPVLAAAGGIVIYAGLAVPGEPTLSYGNCVMIMHNSHLSTLYGHMQLGLHGLQVVPGQIVHQGQIIGYEGMTGWATGPHVHFEMRLNNVQFDPLLLLDEHTITG